MQLREEGWRWYKSRKEGNKKTMTLVRGVERYNREEWRKVNTCRQKREGGKVYTRAGRRRKNTERGKKGLRRVAAVRSLSSAVGDIWRFQ